MRICAPSTYSCEFRGDADGKTVTSGSDTGQWRGDLQVNPEEQ